MKKLLTIVFAAIMQLCFGQAEFIGDSILVTAPPVPGTLDYQVSIQNADNLTENVYYWSDSGQGKFYSPYCNVRVSRTVFDSSYQAISEWSITLKKVDIYVKVSTMTNKKVLVKVTGGSFNLKMKHITYGNWYQFQEGNITYWPSGNLSEGQHILFVPYSTMGEQVATITVNSQGCTQKVSRLFYLTQ